MKEILVVGGGFAGLWAALAATREIDGAAALGEVRTTLISRDDHLTLRPRLYECDPETLRTPLGPVLGPVGVGLIEATVTAIDPRARRVSARGIDGSTRIFEYDRLILAAGSVLDIPPIPGAREHGWSIDDHDAAIAFDGHLRDVARNPGRPGHATFVIVGAGFTGIELAMEMRTRIAAHGGTETAEAARILLVDRESVVGHELGANPRPIIEEALRSADIEVRLGAEVTRIAPHSITFGDAEIIETVTTVLATGPRANPLAGLLPAARDTLGRLFVDDMLRVNGVSGVFATGDIAHARADDDHVALMSCQHALTMGRFAGHNAARELLGMPPAPYRQPRYVTCLDLGSWGSVFTRGWERRIEAAGAAAKPRKVRINREVIYPPTGDRAAILAAAALDG